MKMLTRAALAASLALAFAAPSYAATDPGLPIGKLLALINDSIAALGGTPATGAATEAKQDTGNAAVGATNEAAATASSDTKGLHGLLAGLWNQFFGVASLATDSGNPVKVGGKYVSAGVVPTDGQRVDLQMDARGHAMVTPCGFSITNCAVVSAAGADAVPNTNGGMITYDRPHTFNGSTFDRAFTCPNTAAVSVTAAATTEIVALTASQIIRVCSVGISMSAAGTAKFVYGTGTNCGTGTTDITGAMPLGTTTPLALSAPFGGSLFRTASANALCITAATGNVVGWVSYVKF